jgi:hypothetical protein
MGYYLRLRVFKTSDFSVILDGQLISYFIKEARIDEFLQDNFRIKDKLKNIWIT